VDGTGRIAKPIGNPGAPPRHSAGGRQRATMRFLLKGLTRVPLPVLYALGTFIYFVMFDVFRWRRDQVAGRHCAGVSRKDREERERILRQSYRNIADVVMEAIWGFGASAEALARRVTFENRDLVDAARAARQSVVLLTPHFCNWEWLLPAGGSYFSLPIDAVYQKQRVEFLDIFLRDARSRFGGKPIVREDFVYELMNRAATPRGYALIADQTPPRDDKKHWSRFLNRDTAFFIGAEKVARFLDSPVLYVAHAARRPRPLFGAARGPRDAAVRLGLGARRDADHGAFRASARSGGPRESGRLAVAAKRWKYPKPEQPKPAGRRRRAACLRN
jgi:KDO2-lipid IV(A) lauroyltransferase